MVVSRYTSYATRSYELFVCRDDWAQAGTYKKKEEGTRGYNGGQQGRTLRDTWEGEGGNWERGRGRQKQKTYVHSS